MAKICGRLRASFSAGITTVTFGQDDPVAGENVAGSLCASWNSLAGFDDELCIDEKFGGVRVGVSLQAKTIPSQVPGLIPGSLPKGNPRLQWLSP